MDEQSGRNQRERRFDYIEGADPFIPVPHCQDRRSFRFRRIRVLSESKRFSSIFPPWAVDLFGHSCFLNSRVGSPDSRIGRVGSPHGRGGVMAASHEARIFNTKGHKERLRGMYRNTKYFYGFPTGYGRCVRPRGAGGKAAHRAEARRREPGGPAADHCALPPCVTRGARGQRDTCGAHHEARDAKPRTAPRRGGAMGTSRPTATGRERYAPRGAGGRGSDGDMRNRVAFF